MQYPNLQYPVTEEKLQEIVDTAKEITLQEVLVQLGLGKLDMHETRIWQDRVRHILRNMALNGKIKVIRVQNKLYFQTTKTKNKSS